MSSPAPDSSTDNGAELCYEIGKLVESGEVDYLENNYTRAQRTFVRASSAINEMIRLLARLAETSGSAGSDAE